MFLLTRRWQHHATPSGYDILGQHLGTPLSAQPIPNWLLPDRALWRLARGMIAYDRTAVALELRAVRHMATHSGCLYHLLYATSSYKHLGRAKGWHGNHVIGTFHQPPEAFFDIVRSLDPLKQLDAAIVLGRNQYSMLEGVLPRERIFFVPHGVDTSFFVPPDDNRQRSEQICLCVGHYLRDFATLRTVIEMAYRRAPQLKFIVVTLPDCVKYLDGVVGNLQVYSGISDQALLRHYQTASLLILPLQDAVANNAVLEAMASGLPMVTTDVGAMRDYVDEECARLAPPGNAAAMLEEVLELLARPEVRLRMSTHARERALTFDWNCVAREMRGVYANLLSDSRRVTGSPSLSASADTKPMVSRSALRVAILVQNGVDWANAVGPTVQLRNIINGLRQNGHRVDLIKLVARRVVVEHDRGDEQVISNVWTNNLLFLSFESGWRRLQRLLRVPYLALFDNLRFYEACLKQLAEYDVVYERDGMWNLAGARACKRLQLPYVVMLDGDAVFELDYLGRPLRGIQRWFELWTARYSFSVAKKVICVSEVAKRNLISLRGLSGDKIIALQNAASLLGQSDGKTIRQNLAVDGEPVVMFVGNFYAWHDLDTLLQSFVRVLDRLPKAKLVLVGDGETRAHISKRVDELRLGSSVILTGRVEHDAVSKYLSSADVVVAPYPKMRTEFWGSPMKIFEYMAAGKPIIASRVGQVADVLEHRRTGWLVEPGSAEELTDAIVHLLSDSGLSIELGTNARRRLAEEFTWHRYAQKLENILRQAMDDRMPSR